MQIKNRMSILVLLASSLAAGNTLAAGATGDVVYEKVDIFNNAVFFTDAFMIDTQGLYQATLTDFKFPNALKKSGLNVTTSTDSLGELSGPGAFTFKAGPGDYFVSMFAEAGSSQVSAEEKRRLIEEDQKQRGKEWWHNLTEEEKLAKNDLWKSRTKEEWAEHQELIRTRSERRVEEQLAQLNLGQYGIDISMVESMPSPVPLPAAVWLFGSGILALAGFGRRKIRR